MMTDRIEFPQSRCRVGIAGSDITPPVGMYHRMWGAAAHDVSTGVHRPLQQITLVLEQINTVGNDADSLVFVAIDHCLFGLREMDDLLNALTERHSLTRQQIVVYFSHTHGAGLLGHDRTEFPGGELIPEYLEHIAEEISASIDRAQKNIRPASIVYGTGRCDLAANRDYFDGESNGYVCGFNPDGATDSTVMVGRISDDANSQTIATLVNYACHPTTLAWDNTLISPDYIGAMREVVGQATGAPVFFIQGASGDIGPRDGFVGDTDVADRNGRQLGYAALSAIESLPRAGMSFAYQGPVVSGATIGTWAYEPVDPQRTAVINTFRVRAKIIELAYRSDRLSADQLREEHERWQSKEQSARSAGDEQTAADARAMVERMNRRLARIELLPDGDTYPYPLKLWKIGDAIWLALDGEFYNVLQRELRARFPDIPIIVGTVANGSSVWYLPDESSFGKGLYQEDASILAQGSLETLIETIADEIGSLLDT
jgi:hypothetical protein